MKRLPLIAAVALLLASLGLLGWALWRSARPIAGIVGAALLVLAMAALAALAVRQRERLHSIKRALVRSEMRARSVFDASPDGVVLLVGQMAVFGNPAFRSLVAAPTEQDVAGREFLELVASADRERVAEWIGRRQAGATEPDHLEFTLVRLAGGEIPVEAASALVPAQHGRQLALFLRDLSGRQAVESRLRHMQRLETIADVGDSLVREFETVFRRIRELLHRQEEEAAPAPEWAEEVERLASRGAALARRARSLAPGAMDAGTHRPFDLAQAVRETVEEFQRSLAPALALRVAETAPERLVVSGDPAQLRQALWHALQNAREAQKEGEIQLRTRVLSLDEAAASRRPGSRPGSYAVIEVRDTGPGMTSDVRNRAFEPFFTTKGGRAAGMGLPLIYGTVRAHHGFVELDSVYGRGTIVRLALPLVPEGSLPLAPQPAARDPHILWRGRESVLVVDDDEATRHEVRRILEDFGYTAEMASTPRLAMQRLRQRPRVDLVLLDMVLPNTSGLDLLRMVLKHWPNQRVLMLSQYPLPEQEDQALRTGALGIVRKPPRAPELPRLVREALDRAPAGPA
ncbi:MAG: response regulator [Acidobacteria bacterium]|nr:response regulator [Acidobacteriota bacterium]